MILFVLRSKQETVLVRVELDPEAVASLTVVFSLDERSLAKVQKGMLGLLHVVLFRSVWVNPQNQQAKSGQDNKISLPLLVDQSCDTLLRFVKHSKETLLVALHPLEHVALLKGLNRDRLRIEGKHVMAGFEVLMASRDCDGLSAKFLEELHKLLCTVDSLGLKLKRDKVPRKEAPSLIHQGIFEGECAGMLVKLHSAQECELDKRVK